MSVPDSGGGQKNINNIKGMAGWTGHSPKEEKIWSWKR